MQASGQIVQPDLIPEHLRAPIQALCRVVADLAITIAAGPLGQTLGARVREPGWRRQNSAGCDGGR